MATAVYTDTADLDPSPGIEILRAAGHEVVRLETREPDVIVANGRDAQALLVSYAPIDSALLARLPIVEIISVMATGFDNVDLEAATARGICVANVGGAAAPDVAAHALALALALIRGLPRYLDAAQQDEWFAPPPITPPRTSDLVFGVLGRGRIGAAVLSMAGGVFGRVQFHDPAVLAHVDPTRSVSFSDLLATSDVLVLALPLLPETHRLVDSAFIDRMKQGSYLLNVGRGGVVVSRDVRAAVDDGRLRGVAVDVLDTEPPPSNHPLLGHPRILVTPHTAYLSERTEVAYATITAQNVVDWFAHRPVANAVTSITRRPVG